MSQSQARLPVSLAFDAALVAFSLLIVSDGIWWCCNISPQQPLAMGIFISLSGAGLLGCVIRFIWSERQPFSVPTRRKRGA